MLKGRCALYNDPLEPFMFIVSQLHRTLILTTIYRRWA